MTNRDCVSYRSYVVKRCFTAGVLAPTALTAPLLGASAFEDDFPDVRNAATHMANYTRTRVGYLFRTLYVVFAGKLFPGFAGTAAPRFAHAGSVSGPCPGRYDSSSESGTPEMPRKGDSGQESAVTRCDRRPGWCRRAGGARDASPSSGPAWSATPRSRWPETRVAAVEKAAAVKDRRPIDQGDQAQVPAASPTNGLFPLARARDLADAGRHPRSPWRSGSTRFRSVRSSGPAPSTTGSTGRRSKSRMLMRRLDHSMIFLLIAGTVTPSRCST